MEFVMTKLCKKLKLLDNGLKMENKKTNSFYNESGIFYKEGHYYDKTTKEMLTDDDLKKRDRCRLKTLKNVISNNLLHSNVDIIQINKEINILNLLVHNSNAYNNGEYSKLHFKTYKDNWTSEKIIKDLSKSL